jgi:hypothetical protein
MKKLDPSETVLTGQWIFQDGRVVGDDVCKRIDALTQPYLTKIAKSGWETLFRDPDDGRYWELTYPKSEMHGGGPTELRWLLEDEAKKKYDFSTTFRKSTSTKGK